MSASSRRPSRLSVTLALAASLAASSLAPVVAAAQPSDTAAVISRKPLFDRTDAYLALGFLALTAAATPFDQKYARNLQDRNTQANDLFEKGSNLVAFIAAPGAFIIGGGLYTAGRLGGNERMADLGWHGSEAVFLGMGTTFMLKGIFGRARPETVDAQDARSYRLGRGFGGGPYASFPSGHTTTAFAAAAAVTAETWEWWPKARWIIAPTMYGGATAVGLSRMYNNKHWASDVAMGALLGTFAGIKTVQYHHSHPGNRLDKIMLGARVVPSLDGNALTVSLSPRLIEFPARPK